MDPKGPWVYFFSNKKPQNAISNLGDNYPAIFSGKTQAKVDIRPVSAFENPTSGLLIENMSKKTKKTRLDQAHEGPTPGNHQQAKKSEPNQLENVTCTEEKSSSINSIHFEEISPSKQFITTKRRKSHKAKQNLGQKTGETRSQGNYLTGNQTGIVVDEFHRLKHRKKSQTSTSFLSGSGKKILVGLESTCAGQEDYPEFVDYQNDPTLVLCPMEIMQCLENLYAEYEC